MAISPWQQWDRSVSALVRSSPPVCSTSSHVNSSSNIFWGAQPKRKKHEAQRRVWGSSTSVREPVLGTACRMVPTGILDQGEDSTWAVTVRSLTVTDVGFETGRKQERSKTKTRRKQTQHQFASASGSEG